MNDNIKLLKQYGWWDAYVRNVKKRVEKLISIGLDERLRDKNYQQFIANNSDATIFGMIDNSFIWSETPEGMRFWSHVANGRFKEAQDIWSELKTTPKG